MQELRKLCKVLSCTLCKLSRRDACALPSTNPRPPPQAATPLPPPCHGATALLHLLPLLLLPLVLRLLLRLLHCTRSVLQSPCVYEPLWWLGHEAGRPAEPALEGALHRWGSHSSPGLQPGSALSEKSLIARKTVRCGDVTQRNEPRETLDRGI